jgi:hypothetical protein
MSYTIQGRTVTMPCIVRDAGSASVTYLVDAAVAQRFVGDAFDVVEMMPGQTQLVVGFVDYRDNDLGDYDEVMIVFMVRPKGASGGEGVHIYKLPVNQSFTCEAGCKIWGFPKTVENITVEYTPTSASCRLVMGGKHVFTLKVPRDAAATGEAPDMEMNSYTYLGGARVLAFSSGGRGAHLVPGGDGVELSLGDHPIADDLRQLGLPAAPIMISAWIEHFHGSFGALRQLGG